MPVPKPKPDESQQEFISRCISEMHDIDPDRPQDQIIAICYTQWREAKGESKDTTANVKAETLKEFQPKKFHRPLIYGAELQNPSHWNTGTPFVYVNDITSTDGSVTATLKWTDSLPKKGESFRWMPEIKAELPEGARLYKVVFIKEGDTYHIDWNGERYTRHFTREEIARAARTLIGGYVDENHQFWRPFEDTWIIDAEEEDGQGECIIYSKNPELHKLYDSGKILGVSIEYDVRAEPVVNGFAQQGILLYGLAVVTDPDNPPACPHTKIEVLKNSELESQSRSVTNKTRKKETKMEDNPKPDEVISRLNALEAEVKALAVKVSQQHREDKVYKTLQIYKLAKELGLSDNEINAIKRTLFSEQVSQTEPKDDKQRFINHAKIDDETFQKLYATFGDKLFSLLPERGTKVKQEQEGEREELREQVSEESETSDSPTQESEKSDSLKTESQKPKTESVNQTPKQEGMIKPPDEPEEPEVPEHLKKVWQERELKAKTPI